MSKQGYADELRHRIAELGERIASDRAKLASGTSSEKVAAAGEIADFEKRQAALQARLAELEKEPEGGGWTSMKTSLEEDMLDLETAFNRWARKYYE